MLSLGSSSYPSGHKLPSKLLELLAKLGKPPLIVFFLTLAKSYPAGSHRKGKKNSELDEEIELHEHNVLCV